MLSKRKNRDVKLLFHLLVLLSVLLFSVSVFAEEQVLIAGLEVRSWGTFDPHFSTMGVDNTIIQPIYEGLVSHPYGDFTSFKPGLAEDWESCAAGLEWTFYLKKGVQWHHGFGEFTAEDVQFTFQRLMDEKVGSPYQKWLDIDEVIEVDPYTVIIRLNSPDPMFLLKMINYRGGNILSKKAVTELGDKIATHPVGTGPFEFESYTEMERVVLVRNENYHGDIPLLDKIQILAIEDRYALDSAVKAGSIHLAGGVVDPEWINQWNNEPQEVDLLRPSSVFRIYFHLEKEPVNSILVRKAIAHAINRSEMTLALFGEHAEVAHSVIPPEYWGGTYDLKRYEFNPEKSISLLQEAGYKDGLEIDLYASEQAIMLPTFIIIQDYLRDVGIDLNLRVIEHPLYHEYIRDDRNSMIVYGGARLPDASQFLLEFHHSSSITSFSRTDQLDQMIEDAVRIVDPEKREEAYQQIQRIIVDELHALPLYARAGAAVVRQPYVDLGYEPISTLTVYYQFNPYMQILKK